jgi:hypothetical protein
LTAAPHGVTPFCTWTGGGHLGVGEAPECLVNLSYT